MVHQFTVPHTPEQNGVAERMNQTLMESAQTMLSHANLTKRFWGDGVSTAVYLRNEVPTFSFNGMSPYEKWHGRKLELNYLRVFGCVAYAHIVDDGRKNSDLKAKKLRFVGY